MRNELAALGVITMFTIIITVDIYYAESNIIRAPSADKSLNEFKHTSKKLPLNVVCLWLDTHT